MERESEHSYSVDPIDPDRRIRSIDGGILERRNGDIVSVWLVFAQANTPKGSVCSKLTAHLLQAIDFSTAALILSTTVIEMLSFE